MADHVWVLEHIAAYLADGLETAERLDFDKHLQSCPACSRALTEARALDGGLDSLFADVRPRPGLEDRMIRGLRQTPRRTPFVFASPRGRFALAAAAVVLLGFFGAGLATLMDAADRPPGTKGSLSDLFQRTNQPPADKEYFWVPKHSSVMKSADDLAQETGEQVSAMLVPRSDEGTQADKGHFWVPKKTIAAGHKIVKVEDEFERKPFDKDPIAQKDWVTDQKDLKDVTVGKELPANLPVTKAALHSNEPTLTLLPKGHRAVAISASAVNGAGGFIMPGNRVDLVSTVLGKNGKLTKIFLSDVLVLGVNDQDAKPEDKKTLAPGTVTLALTPEEAERVTWVSSGAQINLFLSRPDDNGVVKTTGAASPWEEKESVANDTPKDSGKEAEKPYSTFRDERPAPPIAYFKPNQPASTTTPPTSTDAPAEAPPAKDPAAKPDPEKKPDETPEPPAPQRKIIRSGEIEFEVEGFDASVEKITKIALEEKGFIGTANSDKLPNGKMRGTLVVRVPPDHLDTLILKLRALGDLKNQRIASQDVTKQYTDTESRLRACRAMEARLLDIIKTARGEIKDLLAAEEELGVWRTKIEEMEGEIRYFNNQVALSTLTITLTEREIRTPFGITETERVEMGVEVEDVDKAQKEAHLAIAEAKGRITKSELKQQSPGQYQAVIEFEVAPTAAGTLRDRLRQFGEVTRLDVGRSQQKEGGSGLPLDTVKVTQRDVHFILSLYNVTNVAPRETVVLDLACIDAEVSYREMLTRVQKAAGRILTNRLDRQRNDQTIGTMQFEIKTADADGVLTDLKAAGEVIHLTITENPDVQNSTRSKRGFQVQFLALGRVAARETVVEQLATRDVPSTYQAILDAVAKAKGRVINAQLDEQARQNVTGFLDFEVRRTEEPGVTAALKAAGDVISRRADRALDSDNVIDSKIHLRVTLKNQADIAPRETVQLGLEVAEVDKAVAALTKLAADQKGRVVESKVGHERNGRVTAQLIFDVPLSAAPDLIEKFKANGVVRSQNATRNPEVPDGELAVARLTLALSNVSPILANDDGFFAAIRRGLSWNFTAISWSLMFVVVGVVFVLPWALLIYGGYRLVRWFGKTPVVASVPSVTPPAPANP